MTPLAAALSPEVFAAALSRVRRSPGAGIDGVTAEEFAAQAGHELPRLRAMVLGGRDRPARLLRHDKRKADGGTRTIGVPTVADRIVQVAVLLAAGGDLDGRLLPNVHGYRPGRSPATALRDLVTQVGERPWLEVAHADVEGLFDHLEHGRLRGVIEGAVPDPLWRGLHAAWLAAWTVTPGRGVPQGAPLSPLLANLFLDRFVDRALDAGPPGQRRGGVRVGALMSPGARLAEARRAMWGAVPGMAAPRRASVGPSAAASLAGWIRYGDDRMLVGAERGSGLSLLRWLDGLVRAAGLRLSDRKTTAAAGRAGGVLPRRVLGATVAVRQGAGGFSLHTAGASGLPVEGGWI